MTASHEIETRLRETAEGFLGAKKVDLFLGYEKATPFRTTPVFVTAPQEATRLAWHPFCAANLAAYLPRLFKAPADAREAKTWSPPTVAVVVKGCDARSVIALIQEHQVPRDRLVLVGIACRGIVDTRKAERMLGEQEALGAGEDANGNIRAVVEDGTEVMLRREQVRAAEDQIPPVKAEQCARRLREAYDSPLWEAASRRCLGCGTCSFLCPTCHCFDITDEVRNGTGRRVRTWDCCAYPLFTLHASGHNPRPTPRERWRQRVMHKFRYAVENFDRLFCVGCGRCIRHCPAGMDLRTVLKEVGA